MKTRYSPTRFSNPLRNASGLLALLGAVALTSCAREDDALQTQIIETRAAMEQRNRELEQTQSQLSELKEKMQRSGGASASVEEIARLKARNAELEDQLASARKQVAAPDAPAKFDMDAIASKLEDDLTRKAKQLRELVQKQTPGGRVDEISLKAIEYPRELLVTFNSAITFNILADNGQKLRLMFPVTADLGGAWKLPAPAEVQAAYVQAQSQPQGQNMAAATESSSSAPAPASAPVSASAPTAAPASNVAASAPAAPASTGGHSGMRQVDANTFVFNWGDGARSGGGQSQAPAPAPAPAPATTAAPAPRPAAPAPPANTPIANFTPPGPGGAAPAAPAPAPSRGPAPAAPAPAAVMPVQQDITIRFD